VYTAWIALTNFSQIGAEGDTAGPCRRASRLRRGRASHDEARNASLLHSLHVGERAGVRRPRDDSHRRFPTLTHSAAVDASVIAGKIVWHRAGGQRRRPIAGGGVERPRCRCSRYRLERRSAQGGIRDDMGCRPAGWPDDVRSSGSLRHPSEGRRCPFAFTGSTSRARGRDRWRLDRGMEHDVRVLRRAPRARCRRRDRRQ
jgi:hypothetical protein